MIFPEKEISTFIVIIKIQYKEFASGGDTQDFGDLLQSIAVGAVVTNGHGGLG